MHSQNRSLSYRTSVRSKSSESLKRHPSMQSIMESVDRQNSLIDQTSTILDSKKEVTIVAHFDRYKSYVLQKAKQFRRFTANFQSGTLLLLVNSRHFNLGLQQMLVRLFRNKKFTISLQTFDPVSFKKIQNWMITFVKRHLEIDEVNRKIQSQHKAIENQISAYLKEVFDKRFQPW